VHPNGRVVYAVGENEAGTLSSFALQADGKLKLLNTVSSRGGGPCHLAFDRLGKWLFTANYNNGSIAGFPVRADGTLGEAASFIQHTGAGVDPVRQKGPHAHSVNFSPDNRYLLAAELGLDLVLVYPFDEKTGAVNVREGDSWKASP